MRLRTGSIVGAFVVLVMASADARAQGFIGGGGGTAFDPQISVVNSGAVLDVQATVSADRKYVTLTMRPQLASLIALREFVFQNASGVVGMQNNGGGNGNANGNGVGNNANNGRATSRGPLMPALARPPEPPPVLLQEGMRRVDLPAGAAPTASPATAAGSSASGK